MTNITVYLTPALSGVLSEIGYFYTGIWIKLYDMPPSVAGVITSGVVFNGLPKKAELYLYIPSQTIGGTTYEEAYSGPWKKQTPTFTDYITLTEVSPPPTENSLSIGVNRISGYPGDTFNFSGVYVDGNGFPLPGYLVTLYRGGVFIGTAVTDIDGQWTVSWTAPSEGAFSFYAEAPES